jgi:tetratricopeptide (TPR) repeat protein
MTFADPTRPPILLAVDPTWIGVGVVIACIVVFGLLSVLALLWIFFRRPFRRRKVYARAQRLLHEHCWEEALQAIRTLRDTGRLSELWEGRLLNTEGECHRAAGDDAVRELAFERALEHYRASAERLGLDPAEARSRVIEPLLAEIRRRFAAWPKGTIASTYDLISRALVIQPECQEAYFWKALTHIREEQWDAALAALRFANETADKRALDPPLYTGILLLRLGQAQEALRSLADANRLDSGCPLVTWQMGIALLAAGGDIGLAVRAFQRCVGPRGFSLWIKQHERMWLEALPEGRSYVRRLATRHAFDCPLLGNNPASMLRQAQLGLAQAYFRQGSFEESAGLYAKLLQESPPTVALLRGYGLALARLERYDQAFKHLKTAFEQEEPKNPLTAAHLALCGARGRPTQQEDKLRNIAWAIRLLGRFDVRGDPQWAKLSNEVFAEARLAGMSVAVEDQIRLCDALASVHAIDAEAAVAYDQLAAAAPSDVKADYAWLFSQSVTTHGGNYNRTLDLLCRTVCDAPSARPYFNQRGWDFDEVVYCCLERHAAAQPGRFPDLLGPDYPKEGADFLLERSRRLEEGGKADEAMACTEVLRTLEPRSTIAHDLLARFSYRAGNFERAAQLLADWEAIEPANPWPLLRRAVIEHQLGQPSRRAQAIAAALARTRGTARAEVAFLGARLALQEARKQGDGGAEFASGEELLKTALREEPGHPRALCCLAALRAATGRFNDLAELAPAMRYVACSDSRFHLLAAACLFAAEDFPAASEHARRVLADPALAPEGHYQAGILNLRLGEHESAASEFRDAAVASGAALDEARFQLGSLQLQNGVFDGAITWWQAIDPQKRRAWGLEETLQHAMFIAGVNAFRAGDYQGAAARLVEAQGLGCPDTRLAALLPAALLKAGRQLLFNDQDVDDPCEEPAPGVNGVIYRTDPTKYRTPTSSHG